MTAAAQFITNFFSGYDGFILGLLHNAHCGFLTFIAKFITLLGEKGIIFFLAALVMMLYPKTRRTGVCLFGAVACGALITNIILKDLIARYRPFYFEPYTTWWKAIGSPVEDDYSFPSGHATAVAAGMTALWIRKGKKWTLPAIAAILLTMLSRNYLLAHYPSDVLVGTLIGIASAFIASAITNLIFRILEDNAGSTWADFCLEWGLPDFAGIPSRLGLAGPARPVFEESGARRERKTAADGPARTAAADTVSGTRTNAVTSASRAHIAASAGGGESVAKAKERTGRAGSGYRGKHER